MTFKQCAASRPDGEWCRRTAQPGSQHCHSHRRCLSKVTRMPMPPTVVRSIAIRRICDFCEDSQLAVERTKGGNFGV